MGNSNRRAERAPTQAGRAAKVRGVKRAAKARPSGSEEPAKSPANRKLVTSLDRALSILELLNEQRPGWSVSELSDRLNIPKSSASYLLHTLAARGYVRRDAATGKYSLGLRLLSLGGQVRQSIELRQVALGHLRRIVEQTQLCAHLAMLDLGDAVYVERIEAPGFVRMAIWPGLRMAPQITAIGKALICEFDRNAVQKILDQHPVRAAASGELKTLDVLLKELEETRRRGYAVDNQESAIGVRCVAAPIYDASGKIVAAIGVSGTVYQLPPDKDPEVGEIILTEARKLSEYLGKH